MKAKWMCPTHPRELSKVLEYMYHRAEGTDACLLFAYPDKMKIWNAFQKL